VFDFMAKIIIRNKDKGILSVVLALESLLIVAGANNIYWYIVCQTPLNLIWAILCVIGFMFFMFYLVAVVAIYRGKQKVMRSLNNLQ
jgi:hypothetical protein